MKFLILLLSLQSQNLFAKEDILAVISNDENKQISNFIAVTDDSTNIIKAFFKDDYIDGKKVSRESLPAVELQKDGIILDKRGDHTVINLKSDNFDEHRGGMIVIDTLFNGINGERKEYDIKLAQSESGWKLFNEDKVVSKLHVEVNKKMFLGSVGVKNIKME
jgi:hypothetical protein